MIKTIFERIKMLASERGLSVSKLEKECGLGNATVRGWATSDPSVSKLKIVADFLGVTIDELVKEE